MSMETTRPSAAVSEAASLSDADIVRRVRDGEAAMFEILMRRHNQRLYRVARSVIRDETEVEDVMQQAYINAFRHLHQFEQRSLFSTWMTRITLNEAFARRRKLQQSALISEGRFDAEGEGWTPMDTVRSPQPDPERQAYAGELRRVLEEAVDALPETYRTVFMLRDIEGLSTTEAGEGLGLSEEAVKTRLHRARALIRGSLTRRLGDAAAGAFAFPATRCDRVVAAVLAAIE
jgi:RNA polymerase sigma-70 factor, ECF subfamily